eukprot:scaffold535667_cov19-Prasinocladus_malaysianus.AAC.1
MGHYGLYLPEAALFRLGQNDFEPATRISMSSRFDAMVNGMCIILNAAYRSVLSPWLERSTKTGNARRTWRGD